MSHRKAYSQGSIPFSWEDSPGFSKMIHHDLGLHALNLSSPESLTQFRNHLDHRSDMVDDHDQDIVKILPLPPCPKMDLPHPRRSSSSKGFWWLLQEDPFLAAYKECTKNINARRDREGNFGGGLISNKVSFVGSSSKKVIRKSKNILSCKKSCGDDVQENNLVIKLPKLPPLPRGTKLI